jgi:hypothetical protein
VSKRLLPLVQSLYQRGFGVSLQLFVHGADVRTHRINRHAQLVGYQLVAQALLDGFDYLLLAQREGRKSRHRPKERTTCRATAGDMAEPPASTSSSAALIAGRG